MPKQGQYKFPYDVCFYGTRDHITSLYLWKQKVIEEAEYFRRGIAKNDFVHTFSVKSANHERFAIGIIGHLWDWLIEQGYKCTVKTESDHVELLISIPKNGRLRLLF